MDGLLKKRTNTIDSKYERMWGNLLGLIDKENEKGAVIKEITEINKKEMKYQTHQIDSILKSDP